MEDIKKITQYLEGAKTMEAAAFTQKSIMDRLNDQINSMDFVRKEFTEPSKPTKSLPVNSVFELLGIFFRALIIPGAIYIAWFCYIAFTPALTTKPLFIFYSTLTIAVAVFMTFYVIGKRASDISQWYDDAIKRYKNERKKYEEYLLAEDKRLKDLNERKQFIIKQGKEMAAGYNSTKSSLTQYYNSCNIIYPKYHNMIAITQILEYLESQRCSSLTGPDGAYNLFESELRMNQIIGNLDVIINSLDQIKNTQYMMYREVQKANDLAERIAQSVEDAAASLNSIDKNSAVAAFNSGITAANSQIIARNSYY